MSRLSGLLGNRSHTSPAPSRAEIRRNDVALFVFVVIMVGASWLFVRWSFSPEHTQPLRAGLPDVHYPAAWLRATPQDDILFAADNPASPSLFNATLRVEATPIQAGETLDSARAALSLRRRRELDRYRELSAQAVTALDGQPALLITWAAVADPTQDSGGNGLPVVIEAQDLILRAGEQWITATVAADAAAFEQEHPAFDLFLGSLGLDRGDR